MNKGNNRQLFWGKYKAIIIISLVYLFSHGFLLIATGRWWDDWGIYGYDLSLSQMFEQVAAVGRPAGMLTYFIQLIIPSKICTFILFFIGSLLYYDILRKGVTLSDDVALVITLLYVSLPVNDARIMRCVLTYTLDYFLFLLAFWLLIRTFVKHDRIPVLNGIGICIIFILSFPMNSCLVFYALPILWLCYNLIKTKGPKSFFKELFKYIYFFIAPFAYFFLKNIFFKPTGQYTGYNKITVKGLFKAVFTSLPAALHAIRNMFVEELVYFVPVAAIVIIWIIINKRKDIINGIRLFLCHIGFKQVKTESLPEFIEENCKDRKSDYVALLVISIIAMFLALYPYQVVRGMINISPNGFNGRDTILFSFGLAIFLYSTVSLTVRERARIYVFGVLILLGVVQLNRWYIGYQKEYYRSVALEYQFKKQPELADYQTMLYKTDDAGIISEHSSYAFNAIAERAYGDQRRLILSAVFDDAEGIMMYKDIIKYHMQQYEGDPNKFDIGIKFSCRISIPGCLKLKYWELFDKDRFDAWLLNNSKLETFDPSSVIAGE